MSDSAPETEHQRVPVAIDGPGVLVERVDELGISLKLVNGIEPYAVPAVLRRAAAMFEAELGV